MFRKQFQFVPVASDPVTGHHWKEPDFILFALSLAAFIQINKIPPEPSFSRESQLSQPFLIGKMLQSFNLLNHPCGSLLGFVQYVCVSPVLRSPELDPLLQMWPRQGWKKGRHHLPLPAGNTLPNAAQDIIHLLCSKGTLLAHVQPGVHQDPQVFFCQATFKLSGLILLPPLYFILVFSLLFITSLLSSCLAQTNPSHQPTTTEEEILNPEIPTK